MQQGTDIKNRTHTDCQQKIIKKNVCRNIGFYFSPGKPELILALKQSTHAQATIFAG